MIQTPFVARQERFAVVGSTNDVVRDWLAAGAAEVCLAVADEQSAGRGREGRTWTAPPGRALLLSLGFRPTWLAPDRAWRLAGVVSLAMADAAEAVAGVPDRTVRLKWPNDLVVESSGGVLKLGGVLGETDGLGGDDPRVVIGIGVNADWPAADFPPELAGSMTSLRELADERPTNVSAPGLLDAFLPRLETGIESLRRGIFDETTWTDRQLTTGRMIRLVGHDGLDEVVRASRCDPVTGALIVAAPGSPGGERAVVSGEVRHVRLDGDV